jgi:diacylglycerol O-acyltransferase / trehalose O-mycolyltransferase
MSSSKPKRPSRRTFAKATVLGATAMLAGAPRTLAAADRSSIAVKQLSSRVYDLGIPSEATGGRSTPVRVVLPSAFATRPKSSWPVLYLLHGAHDDYTSWTREAQIEKFTEGLDLIVAMPDAGPTGIPSKWRDGPDYESFQIEDVQAVLASRYRASDRRVVAGVSTGGYGAMAHAARHPGTFAAVASYSGILDTTLPGVPSLIDTIVGRENIDKRSLWGNPVLSFGTWQEFNPRAQAAGLRDTPLYISNGGGVAGGGDKLLPGVLENILLPAATAFCGTLRLLGIPATENFYPGGGHEWSYWQKEFIASWPILAKGLGLSA